VASKNDEHAVLKMCMTVVAGFPEGPVDDHESPDFLVETGGRTVGIEMQEFIQVIWQMAYLQTHQFEEGYLSHDGC
jgi:hypothetical protein